MRKNKALMLAAICSGGAALLHVGCIVFGGDWYRFLGAGEHMAQMAEAGKIYPALVTALIAAVLSIWSLYALSGAGVVPKLPLLRLGLCLIAAIYLLRGIVFVPLMWFIPDNSLIFWLISSAVSFLFGTFYAVGIQQTWEYLR
jgi:hypothetical protein